MITSVYDTKANYMETIQPHTITSWCGSLGLGFTRTLQVHGVQALFEACVLCVTQKLVFNPKPVNTETENSVGSTPTRNRRRRV